MKDAKGFKMFNEREQDHNLYGLHSFFQAKLSVALIMWDCGNGT